MSLVLFQPIVDAEAAGGGDGAFSVINNIYQILASGGHMQKNTAGKWTVYAFQDEGGANPGDPVTGDATNITANIRIDGGAANAVDDLNPTELEDGYYIFDITAAEANGDQLTLAPATTTANTKIIGTPPSLYTTPLLNTTALGNIGIDLANVENSTSTVDMSGTTIGTVTNVTNLAIGSGGISATASSVTVTTGSIVSGTVADTSEENGVLLIIGPSVGNTDAYLEFDIGGSGIPQQVEWNGYAQSNGDNYDIYFYNWGLASWDQVGSIAGANGTSKSTEIFSATTSHVGTGANLGLVRWRFDSADGTALATDRILGTYTFSNQSIGYVGGAVWLDTNASNTSTEPFVSGTADNPVSTLPTARTIADNLNLRVIHSVPGSAFPLDQSYDNFEFLGYGFTIDLNGQSVNGTQISQAVVSGSSTGINTIPTVFETCIITDGVSLSLSVMLRCLFQGTTTFTQVGTSFIGDNSSSGVPAQNSPVFVFGAASVNMYFGGIFGGVELSAMAATNACSINGTGQYIINANCTGGNLSVRGAMQKTDNSGLVTITEVARYAIDQIGSACDTSISDYDGPTNAEMNARTIVSASYATSAAQATAQNDLDIITGADGVNLLTATQASIDATEADTQNIQSRIPAALVSGRMDSNTSAINNNNTSAVNLALSAGEIVVGAAEAGTLSTTQMTSDLAEVTDDHYIGRVIIWTSGALRGQATDITDYTGASGLLTFTATTEAPSATDSFVIV